MTDTVVGDAVWAGLTEVDEVGGGVVKRKRKPNNKQERKLGDADGGTVA